MVDRPRPPRQKRSSDDDDNQPDYELETPRVTSEPVLPPVPPSIDEVWQRLELEQSRADQRYTLRDLFTITTIASCALAVRQFVRPDWTAAALGFLVLAGLLSLVIDPAPTRLARLTWFTLLMLYILFSALAVFR